MSSLSLGILLIAVGAILYYFSKRPPTNSVHANKGSVAVGGSVHGNVNNQNFGDPNGSGAHGHTLTIIAIVVEIIGICAVAWHTIHVVKP